MPERISDNWVGVISIDTASVAARWDLERADFESLVPDRQAVTIPVENLDAIAASIDEQEQVAGGWILAKGGGHQAAECVKAFAEIGGRRVEEHADGMRKADHREPPELVLAAATARTRRQARRAFAVGMRRRIPLGRSASIGSPGSGSEDRSRRRTVTGRNGDGAGKAGHRSVDSMSWNRRFQAWNFDLATPSWVQNCSMVRPLAS